MRIKQLKRQSRRNGTDNKRLPCQVVPDFARLCVLAIRREPSPFGSGVSRKDAKAQSLAKGKLGHYSMPAAHCSLLTAYCSAAARFRRGLAAFAGFAFIWRDRRHIERGE